MRILIKSLYNNVDALLVSLVLNMNVLRIFLGIQETSILLYFVYFLTIFDLFAKYRGNLRLYLKNDKIIKGITLFFGYIIIFSIISLTWSSYKGAITIIAKFTITLILTFLCLFLPAKKIRSVFIFFLGINLIYGAFFLTNPDRVYSLLGEDMNYLNTTLTLGCCFSVALVFMVMSFLENKYLRLVLWAGLSVFFFVALLGFTARGVLLFPPVIMFFLSLFMGRKHRFKAILLIGLLILLLGFAINVFMSFASDYGASRMLRLFEDTEGEDRIELWSQCTEVMIDKLWYIFGGGVGAFSSTIFYPHNIFIHILGEFGLIPFCIFLTILYRILKSFIILNKKDQYIYRDSLYYVVTGILYYLFTFSKSFSLYDALPLFIMIAFMYPLNKNKNALSNTSR